MTSVLLYLKLLERSSDLEESQCLQSLHKLITHARDDIRQLSVELYPKILDNWGLEAALGQRADELNADGSRQAALQVVGHSPERLPQYLELTFYHVAQEALNKMIHHSRGRCAQLVLKREASCLTLAIQGDGAEFNPYLMRAGRPSGFGLASMRERLALVDRELTIDSQPGSGTHIDARAPMSTWLSVREVPIKTPRSTSEQGTGCSIQWG